MSDFDPNSVDYGDIEPAEDLNFRNVKSGTYDLEISDVTFDNGGAKAEKEGKQRPRIVFKHKLSDGQSPELIREDGDEHLDPSALIPGTIWDQYYFDSPMSLRFLARFVEKMGLSWADYKVSMDKKGYLESLKGIKHKGVVKFDEQYRNNKIAKFLGQGAAV